MLTKAQIDAYNTVRSPSARSIICHAPFTSLNFEQNGNVSACCYNRSFTLGHIPEDALMDIWLGERAEQLRAYIKENDLSGGCSACAEQIQAGNYKGTKAIYYDEYAGKFHFLDKLKAAFGKKEAIAFPKVFEFELSNSCNLECVMCNGYFSSAIRKNREHLPPIKNHYTEAFVEQLRPFIPHLTDAKFLGGEPFLIDIYYKIWDLIIELNPAAKVHITTNGTVLNAKVKSYLKKMKAGIVLSIDSLNKEHYEQIRVNATFDQVMENLHWFKKYTSEKGTYLSIAASPIRANRMDMPEMVRFCNQHDIHLHFNTVWTPEDQSLRFLGEKELTELLEVYEKAHFGVMGWRGRANHQHFRDFVAQVRTWRDEARATEQLQQAPLQWKQIFEGMSQEELTGLSPAAHEILLVEWQHYNGQLSPEALQTNLHAIAGQYGHIPFLFALTESLKGFSQKAAPAELHADFCQKMLAFEALLPKVEQPADMVEEMIRTGFLFQYHFFREMPVEQILRLTTNRFRISQETLHQEGSTYSA